MTDKADFVVVPREPTAEMISRVGEFHGVQYIYKTMLAAAPKFEAGDAVDKAIAEVLSYEFSGEDNDTINLHDLMANAYADEDIGRARDTLADMMLDALQAALPELVKKIQALEKQVAEMDCELSSLRAGYTR